MTSISSGAFMAHIVESAFQCCDSLGGISMGEFVTTSEGAFEDCTSSANFRLGAFLAHTGETFQNCDPV